MSIQTLREKTPETKKAEPKLSPRQKIESALESSKIGLNENSIFYGEEKLKKFEELVLPSLENLSPYIDPESFGLFIKKILNVSYSRPLPPERTKRFCQELSFEFKAYIKNAEGNPRRRFLEGHLNNIIQGAKTSLEYQEPLPTQPRPVSQI